MLSRMDVTFHKQPSSDCEIDDSNNHFMKKYWVLIAVIACALSMSASAEEGNGKHAEHRKALKSELLAKYDNNKDGKIDRSERKSMSKQDKKRARKAGLRKKHHHRHAKTP
jgi:hypothetical protein